MVVSEDKIDDVQKYTFAGCFDGHGNAMVQWSAHQPIEQVHGFTQSHWIPLSDKYSHRIAPADAMIISFGIKNWVMVLWNPCSEASVQMARSGPSTHRGSINENGIFSNCPWTNSE
jgi:hypothetical protein